MLAFLLSFLTNEADKKKFEHLYMTYRSELIHIARSVLSSKDDAEDCVQESYIYLAQHFDTVADLDEEHCLAYLVTIVKSRALDLNDHLNRTVFTLDEQHEPAIDDLFEHVLFDELVEAIRRLPDGYRELLILEQNHGLTVKELTEIFHMSKSAVYRRLTTAKNMLVHMLAEVSE